MLLREVLKQGRYPRFWLCENHTINNYYQYFGRVNSSIYIRSALGTLQGENAGFSVDYLVPTCEIGINLTAFVMQTWRPGSLCQYIRYYWLKRSSAGGQKFFQ
jgi:hypothetical protein